MLGAPVRLRCEYLSNPLGIDEPRPRLSWWVVDERRAEIQTAYRILASSDVDRLKADEADLWDSGKIDSGQVCGIEYAGAPLESCRSVWWKVRTFDSDGMPSPWSDAARFETGLIDDQDWHARWVGTPLMGSRANGAHVPLLRRAFELPEDFRRARLYITALGVYSAEMNGQRVSQDTLAPGWCDYGKRVYYQTYDVTGLVRPGDNVLGVILGDGWYCGALAHTDRENYGNRPLLLAQLQVTTATGGTLVVASDYQWKWQRSWILQADLHRGESVDGRQYLPGWSTPGYDDKSWYPVAVADPLPRRLIASSSPPIRPVRKLQPLQEPLHRFGSLGTERLIYDFGQIFLGRANVSLILERGSHIRLRYARNITDGGELKPPLDAGVDDYTVRGDENGESFEPEFSLHGFRYLEISGEFLKGGILAVEAVVVAAALETTGEFRCDHPFLNKLQNNISWTVRSSFVDVPMAGIASDERFAQTGPTQAFLPAAAFNMDISAFVAKWLHDMQDAQLEEGGFPPAVPPLPRIPMLAGDGGAGWSDAIIHGVWNLYRRFGDRRALERYYPVVVDFLAGLRDRFPDLIRQSSDNPLARSSDDSEDLMATAVFYASARQAARIAGVLGKLSDLENYDELAGMIRSAFRKRFVTHDGRLVGDTQTGYVLALHHGLVEGDERKLALDMLARRIRGDGYHQSIDPVVAPFLLDVLTREGRADLAYQLVLQTSAPSWLHPVIDGATLLVDERGDERNPGIAAGAMTDWLYTSMAGFDLHGDLAVDHNAYRKVRIHPRPPIGVGFAEGPSICFAEASFDSVNGRFEVRWSIDSGIFELQVLIPCNGSALVIMPDGIEHEVAAGRHRFTMALGAEDDGIPVLREVSGR
ncbi:MAG: family 78 glycoside hydrolase catalytic domain [Gammaproteobacteria bacterium]|nr:family 78 glycoside hydrolase catalytic domain [Gammaproteobacteria bacterium]